MRTKFLKKYKNYKLFKEFWRNFKKFSKIVFKVKKKMQKIKKKKKLLSKIWDLHKWELNELSFDGSHQCDYDYYWRKY
jgi:hypothetical protein